MANLLSNNSNITEEEINFKRLFLFFKRNKFLIALIVGILMIPSLYKISTKRNIYESEAKILIEQDKESNLVKKFFLFADDEIDIKQDLAVILKSPYLLNSVHILYKKNNTENPKDFLNWAKGNLEISFINGSSILQVKYKDFDKKNANQILNIITEKYIDYSYKKNEQLYDFILPYINFRKMENILKSTSNSKITHDDYIKLDLQLKNILEEKWKIIQEPTITREIKPFNLKYILINFLTILSIGTLIAFIKEKFDPRIREFDIFINNIECQYLGSLYLKEKDLSKFLFQNFFQNNLQESEIGIIHLDSIFLKKEPIFNGFLAKIFKTDQNINVSKKSSFDKYKKIIILVGEDVCLYKDLDLLKKYTPLIKSKLLGWVYLNK